MSFSYEKQPWEEEVIAIDFARRVPAGVTVPSATVAVSIEETISLNGQIEANYSPHLQLGAPVLTGVTGKEKILAVMVSAGISDFKYRVSFRVTLSDGQKKEDDVWVTVKET